MKSIQIDGSQGEGGGQIVRSSLSLSLVTGRPVVIENIRAGRKKPGLLHQHLTAVQAAAEISGARVEGNELRSSRLLFEPGPVHAGSYSFRVGTAGSTTLVLQTMLPALMLADAPSTVVLEGGTHNPLAPPFEFLQRAFLPLLARTGPRVKLELERYGFYPAGGGKLRAVIHPSPSLAPLSLIEGGAISDHRVRALVARLPAHIGWRECRTIARQLDWNDRCCSVEEITESHGPGNVVFVEIQRANVTEVFTGFGQRGVPAERIARGVAGEVVRYQEAQVPVGEHLADQLLLPLGIGAHRGTGASEFRTMALTQHARTHVDILKVFLDVTIQLEPQGPQEVWVRVLP